MAGSPFTEPHQEYAVAVSISSSYAFPPPVEQQIPQMQPTLTC
ncbi:MULTISPECIES: hypothetical protein [unclassified Streptomyces]|nr:MULTISPECIES: hypothetical protein [unclassified Streptomyces]WSC59198.1 hypothetical protein OG808_07855 [Streptomyces sp. NBC_01761]WSF90329.1 hypothetical protein OIE70_07940 [Streptomyces sp. NBC_01744]WSJ56527.1 hypothetical protein OG243_07975 [Streptomyces sp. NBC_01318]